MPRKHAENMRLFISEFQMFNLVHRFFFDLAILIQAILSSAEYTATVNVNLKVNYHFNSLGFPFLVF